MAPPGTLQVTALLRHDRDLVKKKALLAMQRFLQVLVKAKPTRVCARDSNSSPDDGCCAELHFGWLNLACNAPAP